MHLADAHLLGDLLLGPIAVEPQFHDAALPFRQLLHQGTEDQLHVGPLERRVAAAEGLRHRGAVGVAPHRLVEAAGVAGRDPHVEGLQHQLGVEPGPVDQIVDGRGPPQLDRQLVCGSADLDGKVAVVHFWAPWCGWCLPELDDYQALERAYPGEDVAFLSVVSDTLPEDLASFMDERDYDFAAALDGGAAMGWGVGSWPTTWFLDREGRIVFEQRGYSPHLDEEFRWRIDALLAD